MHRFSTGVAAIVLSTIVWSNTAAAAQSAEYRVDVSPSKASILDARAEDSTPTPVPLLLSDEALLLMRVVASIAEEGPADDDAAPERIPLGQTQAVELLRELIGDESNPASDERLIGIVDDINASTELGGPILSAVRPDEDQELRLIASPHISFNVDLENWIWRDTELLQLRLAMISRVFERMLVQMDSVPKEFLRQLRRHGDVISAFCSRQLWPIEFRAVDPDIRETAHDVAHELVELAHGTQGVILLEDEAAKNPQSDVVDLSEYSGYAEIMLTGVLRWSEALHALPALLLDHVHQEPTDLDEMMHAVQQAWQPYALHKNVHLSVSSHPDHRSPSLQIDPRFLRIALANLVRNALKYTHENGQVVLRRTTGERWIDISVVDTGVGMDSSTLDRVLAIRTRPTQSEPGTRGEPGMGIGLRIVRDCATKVGATLHGHSQPQRGTTFSLRWDRRAHR